MNSNQRMIIKEALRHTEIQLEDTGRIAASADQRAVGFAAMSALIATAGMGLADDTPLPMVNYFGSILILIGSFVAISSCSPRNFHSVGHRWEDWSGHVDDNDNYYQVLISQAQENDDRIKENYALLRDAGKQFRTAASIVVFASMLMAFFQGMAAIVAYGTP